MRRVPFLAWLPFRSSRGAVPHAVDHTRGQRGHSVAVVVQVFTCPKKGLNDADSTPRSTDGVANVLKRVQRETGFW